METNLFTTTNWNLVFGGVFALLLAGIFLYARAVPQGDGKWWVLALLTGGLALAGTFAGPGMAGTLLIDAAAFAAVALIFVDKNPEARQAAPIYLAVVAAAVVALLLGERLSGNLAAALILVGFALKLALAPVYFWLPKVAERAAPMSVALIISVVDIAAFRELVHLRENMPWVFTDHQGLWIAAALLSMFGGALLALGQRNLRRMLAFSTIDDMGYLLLGVAIGSPAGLEGALLGALAHAIFKVLLFGAVGVAEHRLGYPPTLDDCGLAARFPVCGAAFIAGSLGMIGVPPLMGFAGRWRLYLAGVSFGGVWLGLLMALATVLALFYYVRAIHTVWLGNGEGISKTKYEPRLAAGTLVVLAAASVLLGLVPAWLLNV